MKLIQRWIAVMAVSVTAYAADSPKSDPPIQVPDFAIVNLSKIRNSLETSQRQVDALVAELRKASDARDTAQKAWIAAVQKAQAEQKLDARCYPDDNWNWIYQEKPGENPKPCPAVKGK